MLAKTMPESEFAQANSVLAETIPRIVSLKKENQDLDNQDPGFR